ncbi:DUF1688 family protein [Cupriavidus basilensis]
MPSIAAAFQVAQHNRLVGLDGRAGLLRRLGEVARATPAVFGTPARLGNLYDYLQAHAVDGRIEAGIAGHAAGSARARVARGASASVAYRWGTAGHIRPVPTGWCLSTS